VLREAFVPLFGLLSFYVPTYLSASGTAQDGRAQPGAGSPRWLRWRRRFTARPVWVFFFFFGPRCAAAIIPRDGKGWKWNAFAFRNRTAIILTHVAVVLQFCSGIGAVPCGHCIHASLGTVFFSLPSSFFAPLLVLLLSSCSEQLAVLFPRARFLHSCFACDYIMMLCCLQV
jgi:hypothetical protein